MNNDWKKQFFQILREIRNGNYLFTGNFLSRIPQPVELSHEWIKKNSKYQDQQFYSILFDDLENGSFEAPPGRIKTSDKKNQ